MGRRNVSGRVSAALIAEVTQWRNNSVTSQAEGDEEMLTFDIPEEALERAAGAEQQATTWVHCTHPWYYLSVATVA